MINSEEKEIINLLQKLLRGQLDVDTVLDRWPKSDKVLDDLVLSCWHELHHFKSDKDIRERDKDYEIFQIKKIENYLDGIKKKYELGE